MRVLILYTELAGYVVGNINRFLNANLDSNVLLIHYRVNDEAPFIINMNKGAELIEYQSTNHDKIESKILNFNADLVLCSGWSNQFYLDIVKLLPNKVKKVICFDNRWKGTLKQYLLRLVSKIYLLKYFEFAWVPGQPQKEYALKLGFKAKNIFTGLYPADTAFFEQIGSKKIHNEGEYPKTILSIARYIPQKDLPTLWKAFISANNKTGNKWILNSIGLGELYNERMLNPYIYHLGFKQPFELESYILEAGVFVLPSIDEPWGVVVHEMALSALPMILSDQVGASSMFLSSKNGFQYQAGNELELEKCILKIMRMDDDQLKKMSKNSFQIGQKLLSDDWTKTLIQIIESN